MARSALRPTGVCFFLQDDVTATPLKQKAPAQRRQQQRSIDTRSRITAAALSQFALLGFDGASTRGVAEAAGVPHSLVLHHYKTKSQLWIQTAAEIASKYSVRVFSDEELAGLPIREQLRCVLSQYIRFSAEFPEFFLMVTQENMRSSDQLAWLVENHSVRSATFMMDLIQKAQAAGQFAQGDPLQLLYMFLGCATAPYRSAAEIGLIAGVDIFEPVWIERHVDTCLQLFFGSGS